MVQHSSPYLDSPNRLADILAAIQVMGSYPLATRNESKWQEKLGSPLSAPSWVTVFEKHPEFFRVNDEGGITLRWRHGYDRIFRTTDQRELLRAELDALSEEDRKELTRKPLTEAQIETLLNAASELHTRAIAYAQERKWLSPAFRMHIVTPSMPPLVLTPSCKPATWSCWLVARKHPKKPKRW
jgi:hypothetical protein